MQTHYEFGMEKVLSFRKLQKNLAVTQLAEAERELQLLHGQLEQCRNRIAEIINRINRLESQEPLDITSVLMSHRYLLCLREEEEQMEVRLSRQELEVSFQRHEVMERSRDQKVMEHLKDRDYKAFQTDKRRKEANDADEMVLLRSTADQPSIA